VVLEFLLLVVTGFLIWLYRYWPEEPYANKFFAPSSRKNFEAA